MAIPQKHLLERLAKISNESDAVKALTLKAYGWINRKPTPLNLTETREVKFDPKLLKAIEEKAKEAGRAFRIVTVK
jgi:hypothetical protein